MALKTLDLWNLTRKRPQIDPRDLAAAVLKPQLDKEALIERLRSHAGDFMATPRLRQIAEDNWQILYGEALPQ